MEWPRRLFLNQDLLGDRAADIRGALGLLRGYAALPRQAFLADQTVLSAAKYQLIVAIEAAQAICNHLAARVARRAPSSYADCYRILGESGVLPPDLAARLADMAKFRKVLVHRYASVDDNRVHEIINRDLGDLEEFLAAVHAFVTHAEGSSGPDRAPAGQAHDRNWRHDP
ncbi:MAG: type VII toxin-antitoxin system HepT family RNase toxin [Desulfotomaculales bacterium]